jgi:hypothetical protein
MPAILLVSVWQTRIKKLGLSAIHKSIVWQTVNVYGDDNTTCLPDNIPPWYFFGWNTSTEPLVHMYQ